MPTSDQDHSLTLDPPGSIAVIGGGPLGIEAALYGRYLGYDVTVYEAIAIGASMLDQMDSPLPMLPDRCLSSLAISALDAQRAAAADTTGSTVREIPTSLPMTYDQWIKNALIPLTETDLLRRRVLVPARVTRIVTVPIEADTADEDTSDIPPDFRLTYLDSQQKSQTVDFEAIILATGSNADATAANIELEFTLPADYFFRISCGRTGDPEQDLRSGRQQIVTIYAGLAGRSELDLHRPRRG